MLIPSILNSAAKRGKRRLAANLAEQARRDALGVTDDTPALWLRGVIKGDETCSPTIKRPPEIRNHSFRLK